jgi:hypothetical protein
MILQPGKLYVVKVQRTLYTEPSSTLSNPKERYSEGKYIQQLDKNTTVMLVKHVQQYSWSDCKLLTPDGVSGWIFFPTRQVEDIFKEP